MEGVLLFFEEQQSWIYFVLAMIGVLYLRSFIVSYRASRRAIFSLERERAVSRITRSVAMMVLVLAGATATYLTVNFASPAIPATLRSTSLPTVSLLATPVQSVDVEGDGEPLAATPIPSDLDGAGCLNEKATIIQPTDGETISGTYTILGVADIVNFAFYKVEYRRLDGVWWAITASTQPVCETCAGSEELSEELVLGTWDTRLVEPGVYEFRLVVMDTEGNAPLPCEIQIRILPSE